MLPENVRPRWVLPSIVTGQVLATSTWFAANAVAHDMGRLWSHGERPGQITLMVQLGFIVGTLIIAATGCSDRMSSRRMFLYSAFGAAIANVAILIAPANYLFALACRFATGAALAGVYPIGMKLAASWYPTGLGRALGFLVGALVLGTSLTHLMRALPIVPTWQYVIVASSLAAMVGGLLVYLVPDGPHLKRGELKRTELKRTDHKPANFAGLPFTQLHEAWSERRFRQSVVAYFGHMWELYTFWAFVPRWIDSLNFTPAIAAFFCFVIIAVGTLGCALGGIAADWMGSRRVARLYLAGSATCCLLSPIMYGLQPWLLILFLIVWGVFVVGDSPQLSSLNAQSAPRHLVGSALTATTCIGFSITVLSLLFLDYLGKFIEVRYLFLPLAIGPIIGCVALRESRHA